MAATRFEPSPREVSDTLTALVVMGPWGIDGLFDYFDELEWEPHSDRCVDCDGSGYRENFRECKACNTTGSLHVAIYLSNQREAPEPYIETLLREAFRGNEEVTFVKSWDTKGRQARAPLPCYA